MKLITARLEFTRCVALLLVFAAVNRIPLILDEARRHKMVAKWNAGHCRKQVRHGRCEKGPEEHPPSGHVFAAIGILESTHRSALAIDAYVIRDGKISSLRSAYAILGAHWKTLHPLARWGGDFKGFADLGHFSFEWRGRQ